MGNPEPHSRDHQNQCNRNPRLASKRPTSSEGFRITEAIVPAAAINVGTSAGTAFTKIGTTPIDVNEMFIIP